jgi:hypothetical protein
LDRQVGFLFFFFFSFWVFWGLDGSLVFHYYLHATGTTTSCHCFFPTIRLESLWCAEFAVCQSPR